MATFRHEIISGFQTEILITLTTDHVLVNPGGFRTELNFGSRLSNISTFMKNNMVGLITSWSIYVNLAHDNEVLSRKSSS